MHMKPALILIAVIFLGIAAGVCGCTTGPVLYPNAHLQNVGSAQARREISECRVLADHYVKSNEGIAAAKSTAVGAAGGAIIGFGFCCFWEKSGMSAALHSECVPRYNTLTGGF